MSLNDPNVIPLADVVYAARQEARDAEFEGRHEDFRKLNKEYQALKAKLDAGEIWYPLF